LIRLRWVCVRFSLSTGWFMTLRSDVVRSRDLLACWRELAEERLEYLTEMFESGRWRRYYSEYAFLENIREAKRAVETWRVLSTPGPAANPAISISWLAPERPAQFSRTPPRLRPRHIEPAQAMPAVTTIEISAMGAPPPQVQTGAPFVDMFALEQALDGIAGPDGESMEQRYPLLRHSL
jgi:uncharacterized repeat protein (TIGR03809 family)